MPRGRDGVLPALVVALALAVPAAAEADDGEDRDDVRVTASCSRAGEAELRLRRRDDDRVRLDFELRDAQRAGRWLVVVVHERRLVFRGSVRASRSSGRLSLRRTFPDFFGEDTVRVRASGPRGATCRLSATLSE